MELTELITGPAFIEALKIRVETLTKANRKLADENKQLKEENRKLINDRDKLIH